MSLHSIYLEEGKKTLTTIDPEQVGRIADILWQARNEERTVFIFGNGGSAALSVHFAGDVSECTGKAAPNVRKRLRVQCLAENLTTIGLAGYSGGRLKDVVAECVHIPIHDMQHVEDAHTHVTHMIMKDIQARMEAEEVK